MNAADRGILWALAAIMAAVWTVEAKWMWAVAAACALLAIVHWVIATEGEEEQ